tara:strand:+ start:11127 stop:11867 length:741 start_codon:yes stop_codon:yes gene_type:complete
MSRRVFITGSSSGIGAEIAKKFISLGDKVVINGRDKKKLEKVKAEINAIGSVKADFSINSQAENGILKAADILKKFDILICNVGSGKSVKPGNETHSEWEKVFNQNLWSAISAIDFSKKYMAPKSSIICISSICGMEAIKNAPVTYSVSKAALNAYIKSISFFLGKRQIRINGISPGNILFDDSVWEKNIKKNAANVKKMLKNEVALNRLGSPKDVSELTSFLCSKEANFITGSIFVTDGGQIKSF